ncbi:MAG: tRNA lysidine(34) synthetase TilS [Candidatus Gracilibacteria bacterium]|nr:tRNA lysidine(34) synthetase TilS [Candidatus Gracilibacteria bacterium]
MDLNLQSFLEKYYSPDEKVILACSTGPDSMFLLYELLKTTFKNNIVACYFNHKLRVEADEEEKFLENLGKKLNFQVEIASANIKEIRDKLYPSISIEELAREKRYMFFSAICEIHKTKKVLTAHHLDDKIETFFFNLSRGSKLTGFINMTNPSPTREKLEGGFILRPLLNLEKSEILKYLDENKLEYRIDKTNFDIDITRNLFRNEIIPKFFKVNSNFKNNISNTLNYFEELKNYIDDDVKRFLKEKDFFIISDFHILSIFLQKEIIRYIYFISNGNSTIGLSEANISEIIKFINGKNNKTIKEIKNLKMKKDGNRVYY